VVVAMKPVAGALAQSQRNWVKTWRLSPLHLKKGGGFHTTRRFPQNKKETS